MTLRRTLKNFLFFFLGCSIFIHGWLLFSLRTFNFPNDSSLSDPFHENEKTESLSHFQLKKLNNSKESSLSDRFHENEKTVNSSRSQLKKSSNSIVPSFKVYNFEEEFSPQILSYFASCKQNRRYDSRNLYSHLGAKFFSLSRLKLLKWFNGSFVNDVSFANIILIPLEFTLAITARCGKPFKGKKRLVGEIFRNDEEFMNVFESVLDTLIKYKTILHKKSILMIMQSYQWDKLSNGYSTEANRKLVEKFTEVIENLAESNTYVFVGHFENNVEFKNISWNLKDGYFKNGTETIVLPYTTPIEPSKYQKYNNMDKNSLFSDFQKRPHSLFFMGTPSHLLRIRTLQYMMNPSILDLNPFGIINYSKKVLRMLIKNLIVKQNKKQNRNIMLDRIKEKEIIEMEKKINLKNFSVPECTLEKRRKKNKSPIKLPSLPCLIKNPFVSSIINQRDELYFYGLKNSKFNVMVSGDTPTSGNFYYAIAFNMINIIVGIEEKEISRYLPFSDVIPYHKFCIFISSKMYEFEGANILYEIVTKTTDEQVTNMLLNLSLYKSDILWNIKGSRVVWNVFNEVHRKHEYIMTKLNQSNID